MFVVRTRTVFEDRLQRVEVLRVGIEPGVDVLGLDRDDAAIVVRSGNLCRWFVRNRSERQQICSLPYEGRRNNPTSYVIGRG